MSPPSGFSRIRRVVRRVDFQRGQRAGARVTSPHFVLILARSPQPVGKPVGEPEGEPARAARLGLVVSRKVGNAVARNRVKRLCRECFRLGRALDLPKGLDLLVIARDGSPTLALADVEREWRDVARFVQKRAAAVLAGIPPEPRPPRRPGTPTAPGAPPTAGARRPK